MNQIEINVEVIGEERNCLKYNEMKEQMDFYNPIELL